MSLIFRISVGLMEYSALIGQENLRFLISYSSLFLAEVARLTKLVLL